MQTKSKKLLTAALAALALTTGSLVATGDAFARGGHGGHGHGGHGHGGHAHFGHLGHFAHFGHRGHYAWHGHFRRYGWHGHYRHYGWRHYRHYAWRGRWYGRWYAGGSCWVYTRLGPVNVCRYYYR